MKRIILIGMKSSGKTTIGRALAEKLRAQFIDMDSEIERRHFELTNESLWFREIFKRYGQDYFRSLETAALENLTYRLQEAGFVLATGGGLPLDERNQKILAELGTVIFIDVAQDALLPRIISGGAPAFFPYPNNPQKSLAELLEKRRPIYMKVADITLKCSTESPRLLVDNIITTLEENDDAN
jgi:shikimate kinase